MIALQEDGPRPSFPAVERAAGDARNLAIGDDGDSVLRHAHMAPNQHNVVALPFARPPRHLRIVLQEAINAAHVAGGGSLRGIVLNLYFVTAAQIDTTVTALR